MVCKKALYVKCFFNVWEEVIIVSKMLTFSFRSNNALIEFDFAWRSRIFAAFVAMEHILALVLKILLSAGQVRPLGEKCDAKVYVNSIIKVQVTIFLCLTLSWVLKPDEARSNISNSNGDTAENDVALVPKRHPSTTRQGKKRSPSQTVSSFN